MSEIITAKTTDGTLQKYAISSKGIDRLSKEAKIYFHLQKNTHIAKLLDCRITSDEAKLSLEYIDGISLKKWLGYDVNYKVSPRSWKDAESKLAQYTAAEMSLLASGILYRDLNLEHVIFSNSQAKMVDLEASIIESSSTVYILNDMRGTWETMASEEFNGFGELSPRTATYRTAVIAHLTLYGILPFERDSQSRSNSRKLRFDKPLKLSGNMSKTERKLFSAALSIKPVHRHKDPEQFYTRLKQIHTR